MLEGFVEVTKTNDGWSVPLNQRHGVLAIEFVAAGAYYVYSGITLAESINLFTRQAAGTVEPQSIMVREALAKGTALRFHIRFSRTKEMADRLSLATIRELKVGHTVLNTTHNFGAREEDYVTPMRSKQIAGATSSKSKAAMVNGKWYHSMGWVDRELGLREGTARKRVMSTDTQWADWRYATAAETELYKDVTTPTKLTA